MKKHVHKLLGLLLVCLVIFTSCKHKGLPVTDGFVQVVFSSDGICTTYEIPLELYDALFDDFKFIIKAYNSDKVLSEELFEEKETVIENYWSAIRYPNEKELRLLFPSNKVNPLLEKLTNLSDEQHHNLMLALEGMCYCYSYIFAYLEEIANIYNGSSTYNSNTELYEAVKEGRFYEMYFSILKQLFPKIEIKE